jgi:uncharacterized protein YdeI (YjbR/CyaY-like superfamily)
MDQIQVFYPTSLAAWKEWLAQNHDTKQAVWLVFYSKRSSKASITWSEAVDVALCYGWIDGKKVSKGKDEWHHFFTRRKEKSTWSKINKEKVSRLIAAGLMTKAGFSAIEVARQNGSWSILDKAEELAIPKDLAQAFRLNPGSKTYFLSLSKSVRKAMLQWIVLAKRPETRQKRIGEIAAHAALKQKPKQF